MVGSATLVAFTVTVWELVIEAGAVYRPAAVMLPATGLIDHVTAVLPLLVTVAVKLWVWDCVKVALAGATVTCTGGVRVTVAAADFVGLATLVAFTVTVWELEIEAGAVYRPTALMLPTTGLIDQVTAVLPLLVTVAVKLWV